LGILFSSIRIAWPSQAKSHSICVFIRSFNSWFILILQNSSSFNWTKHLLLLGNTGWV
jgi:hypothetical protein